MNLGRQFSPKHHFMKFKYKQKRTNVLCKHLYIFRKTTKEIMQQEKTDAKFLDDMGRGQYVFGIICTEKFYYNTYQLITLFSLVGGIMNDSLSNFSIFPKIYACVKLMFNQNKSKRSSHLRQAASRNTISGPSFSRKPDS